MLRRAFLVYCAVLLISTSAKAVEFRHLAIRYVEAKSFVRISEYFTGRENSGNRLLCRSRPNKRAGLYFVLTLDLKSRKLPERAVFVLEVIRPDDPETKLFRIPIPEKRPRGREVFLGLTGMDWPDEEDRPVAWRLRLLDAGGGTLAERKSFLWERPQKEKPVQEGS